MFDGFHVRHHQSERLVASTFAPAQLAHDLVVLSIAGELKPAEPFDSKDPAGCQQTLGLWYFKSEGGAALRTSVGLGVEAPVSRIVVLGLAGGAHAEGGHGGRRPVIRNIANNRVPRPAIGAVGERITVPAV